jgi:hypothetical protein
VSDGFQLEHRPFAESGKTLQFLSPGGIGGRTNIRLGFGKRLRIGPLVAHLCTAQAQAAS